jgi:hypothetical protein
VTVKQAPHPFAAAWPRADQRWDAELPAALGTVLDAVLDAVPPRPFATAHRWWVIVERSEIEVHVAGAPHGASPADAATRVAAGTALLAVRLAVASSGYRPVTTLLPGGLARSAVAVVRPGVPAPPTPVERVLFAALCTPRSGMSRAEVPLPAVRARLRAAADAERLLLRTAATAEERARLFAHLPARPVPAGGLLVLLTTEHGLPVSGLRAGQGLQRVLCTAGTLGLLATVLAGPAELWPPGRPPRPGAVPQVLVHVRGRDEPRGQVPPEEPR